MQDEILTDLAKVADLRVIARASVKQYRADAPRDLRAIAAELGVAHVLTGSVQRVGNQVRVHAPLIDVRTSTEPWAESYLKALDDVFAIQSEIALAIVGQLQARLSPQEKSAIDQAPTTDVAAYDLYLCAQDLFERNSGAMQGGDKVAAVPLLEQALACDPKFLAAQCLLAACTAPSTGIRTTHPRAWNSSAPPCKGPCAWPRTRGHRIWHSPTTTTSAATTRRPQGSWRWRRAPCPTSHASPS